MPGGHGCITRTLEPDHAGADGAVRPRAVVATPGKGSGTLEEFVKFLAVHNGKPEDIEEICRGMSPAFLAGIRASFPRAHVVLDRFHVTKTVMDAPDAVRKGE